MFNRGVKPQVTKFLPDDPLLLEFTFEDGVVMQLTYSQHEKFIANPPLESMTLSLGGVLCAHYRSNHRYPPYDGEHDGFQPVSHGFGARFSLPSIIGYWAAAGEYVKRGSYSPYVKRRMEVANNDLKTIIFDEQRSG